MLKARRKLGKNRQITSLDFHPIVIGLLSKKTHQDFDTTEMTNISLACRDEADRTQTQG